MRAADLDDVPEFFRLRLERVLQFFQGWEKTIFQLFGRADVDRRGNDIVARLSHVDVIVGVNVLAGSNRFALELSTAVCDHFIGVRVRAGSRAGLKNIERKMIVEFSLRDFLGRLHDQSRALCIQQTKIVIGLCGRPFDQPQRANKRPRKPVAAHRKIEYRAMRGGAMQRMRRKRHLAHRIFFDPSRLFRHAERSAPTPASRETFFRPALRRARV